MFSGLARLVGHSCNIFVLRFFNMTDRPVAERGALPPERAIHGTMFFWRRFARRIRIRMLIGRARGRFRDMGGLRRKISNAPYQSILRYKYKMVMPRAVYMQA